MLSIKCMLLEHNMNVPRFSYLTTFGDEPLLHNLCKKKALLKRAFFIYPTIFNWGRLIISISLPHKIKFYLMEKVLLIRNTLKHWIFIQILIYIINKLFYCCTLYNFTIYKCKRSFKTNTTIP